MPAARMSTPFRGGLGNPLGIELDDVPTLGPYQNHNQRGGFLNSLEQFGSSFGYGLADNMGALSQLMTDPYAGTDMLEGIYGAASHPKQSAAAAWEYLKGAFNSASGLGGLAGNLVDPSHAKMLLAAEKLSPLALAGMTAYHGSPHNFDKFDIKKIGTGEGAQAYGHGLYFAEDPKVAGAYRHNLTRDRNVELDAFDHDKGYGAKGPDGELKWFDNEKDAKDFKREQMGGLYNVDIPDEHIEKMLDWDAPLSEQPESVKSVLMQYAEDAGYNWKGMEGSITGEHAYNQLMSDARDWAIDAGKKELTTLPSAQARASEHLKSLGIPGIKYYDGGSRSTKKGTRNFVVFDDSIVKILGKE